MVFNDSLLLIYCAMEWKRESRDCVPYCLKCNNNQSCQYPALACWHMHRRRHRAYVGVHVDMSVMYALQDERFILQYGALQLQRFFANWKITWVFADNCIGDVHDYLGIKWDFTIPGQVSLPMEGYLAGIFACYNVIQTYETPATDKPFVVNDSSLRLTREKSDLYLRSIWHFITWLSGQGMTSWQQ